MKDQTVKENQENNQENINLGRNVFQMDQSQQSQDSKQYSDHVEEHLDLNTQNEDNTEIILDEEEKTLSEYIAKIVGKKINLPLVENLQSGVILCEFANSIISINNQRNTTQGNRNKKESKIFAISSKKIDFVNSRSPFIQRENIAKFIKFAEQFVEPYELFETEDLYSNRNPQQVWITLYSLSRNLKYRNLIENCIGPQQYSHEKVKKKHFDQQPIFTFYEQRKNELGNCGRRQISVDMMLQPKQKNHTNKSSKASQRNVETENSRSCAKKKEFD